MAKFSPRKSTDYVILHCADTYARMNTTVADIDGWHRQRGFIAIGYHYVILRDGSVEAGRPDHVIGAHCREKGRNRDSIGICLVGGRGDDDKPEDNFTPEQLASLKRLIKKLHVKYGQFILAGHRDFSSRKTCPNFDYFAHFENEASPL